VEVGAQLLIFFTHFGELGGNGVQLGGDGHYAGDCGTEDGENGAFTGSDGLEGMGGEVLHQVGVELEAIPGFCEYFRQESERGGGACGGGRRGGFLETGGVGAGNGSSQSLVAWRDGFDLHEGTGGGDL